MRFKSRPGFSLLEAVVALAIVALVVVSALTTLGQQLRTAAHGEDVVRAAGLARQRLGWIRFARPTEFNSLPDSLRSGRFPPPEQKYTWLVTTAPVQNEEYLEDVRVEVRWPTGSYALQSRVYAPPAPVSTTEEAQQQ